MYRLVFLSANDGKTIQFEAITMCNTCHKSVLETLLKCCTHVSESSHLLYFD